VPPSQGGALLLICIKQNLIGKLNTY